MKKTPFIKKSLCCVKQYAYIGLPLIIEAYDLHFLHLQRVSYLTMSHKEEEKLIYLQEK